jgi:threonine 3-dehydrogenase
MTKLITGGTGYIGAEVARLLVRQRETPVLFDISPNNAAVKDIRDQVKIVRGDLGNCAEVLNVVRENNISEIYHLGSMLTGTSEENPWGSFQANVIGTYNILEAARMFSVKRMMFTSTLGTYGIGFGEVIDDETLQRPITMYGCGKLYGEGLGRFYHKKFGLDFRSVRFAYMVGWHVRTPNHWAPPMIEDAILGKAHECIYATPETAVSLIHVHDAALSCVRIMEAPAAKIATMNYNVTGVPRHVSARELERILKMRYPGFTIKYLAEPLPGVVEQNRMYGKVKRFDDSRAREEWGWQPQFGTPEAIVEIMEREIPAVG